MKFPESIEGLRVAANAEMEIVSACDDRMRVLETEKRDAVGVYWLLDGILGNSWQSPDPGKDGSAFFFLDRFNKRVVVREFLPEGTRTFAAQSAWEEYRAEVPYGVRYEHVPFHYSVMSLRNVREEKCPECGTMRPVVERYAQTMDSPDGDEWTKEYFVLCLACNRAANVGAQTSSNRMY